MAEEGINIAVTDTGTQELIELLNRLGITGEDALLKIEKRYFNLNQAQDTTAAQQKIVNAAMQDGGINMDTLGRAVLYLDDKQVKAAASAEGLARLTRQAAQAATEAAAAVDTETAALDKVGPAAEANARAVVEAKTAEAAAIDKAAAASREAADVAKISNERLVSSFRDRTGAAQENAAKEGEAATQTRAGASAVTALGEAAGSSVGKVAGVSGEVEKAGQAARNASSAIGGVGTAIAGFVAASAAISASDAYTKLKNELQQVTAGTDDFNNAYERLLQAANGAQTDINTVGTAFTRFKAAAGDSKFSTDQLVDAVSGLAKGLALTGSTTQETQRVVKDFSEALATGGLKGRQLLSVLQQAPAFAKIFGDALGINLEQLRKTSDVGGALQGKLDTLKEKYDNLGNTSHGSVSGLTSELKRQEAEYSNATQTWLNHGHTVDAVGQSYKQHQKAVQDNENATAKYIQTTQKLSSNIADTRAKLDAAKIATNNVKNAERDGLESKIKYTQAALDLARAQEQNNPEAIIEALIKLNKIEGELTASQTTFSGALNVLHNNFENLFRDGTTASATMDVLKGAILLVAHNLDTALVAVGLFGAGLVALKIEAMIGSFAKLGAEIAKTRTYQLGLTAVTNPWLVALGLIAAAIVYLVGKYGDWTAVNGVVQDAVNGMWADIQPIYDQFGQAVQTVSKYFVDHQDTIQHAINDVIVPAIKFLIEWVGGLVKEYILITNTIADFVAGCVNGFNQVDNVADTMAGTIGHVIGQIVKGFDIAIQKIQDFISWVETLYEKLKALLGIQQATGVGGGGSGGGSGGDAASYGAGYRNGGSFVVPGGTGVDSVPLNVMVSPGELVSIQTPSQAAGHVPTPANDNGHAYATGGYFSVGAGTGFGVSLGTSLATANITGGSVTGYTPASAPNSGSATGTGTLPGLGGSTGTGSGSSSSGSSGSPSDPAATVDLKSVLGWDRLTAAAQAAALAAGVGIVKEIFDSNYKDLGKGVQQLDGNFLINNTLYDSSGKIVDLSQLDPADPALNASTIAAYKLALGPPVVSWTPASGNGSSASGGSYTPASGSGIGSGGGSTVSSGGGGGGGGGGSGPLIGESDEQRAARLTGGWHGPSLEPGRYASGNKSPVTPGYIPPKAAEADNKPDFIGPDGTHYPYDPQGHMITGDGRVIGGSEKLPSSPDGSGVPDGTPSGGDGSSVPSGGYSPPSPGSGGNGSGGSGDSGDGIPGTGLKGTAVLAGTTVYLPKSGGYLTWDQLSPADQAGASAAGLGPKGPSASSGPSNAGGIGHARDGAEFYVNGMGGVDNNMVHLAVSGGETVSVKTPAQQQAANNNQGHSQTNHFTTNVYAKDVDSFGQSQQQFAASQMRMARRVARRA